MMDRCLLSKGRSTVEHPRRIAWLVPVLCPLTMIAAPISFWGSARREFLRCCAQSHERSRDLFLPAGASRDVAILAFASRHALPRLPVSNATDPDTEELDARSLRAEGPSRRRHGSILCPAFRYPSPRMGARVVGLDVPMRRMRRSIPAHGCTRPAEGTILCHGSLSASSRGAPASMGRTHPCGCIGDRVARRPVASPGQGHTHGM